MITDPGYIYVVYRHDWGSDEFPTFLSASEDLRVALIQILTDADASPDENCGPRAVKDVIQALQQIITKEYYIVSGETHQYPVDSLNPKDETSWHIHSIHDCDQH